MSDREEIEKLRVDLGTANIALVKQMAITEALLERLAPDARADVRKRGDQIYATMMATAESAAKELEL